MLPKLDVIGSLIWKLSLQLRKVSKIMSTIQHVPNTLLILNVIGNLLDIANLFQLKQIITEATRITEETQALLDLFFTNKPENIINSGVVHLGVSDHCLIYGCRKISLCKTSPKIVESRNFRHYKTLEFKRDLSIALSNCDWSADDPNALWKQFRDRFNDVSK